MLYKCQNTATLVIGYTNFFHTSNFCIGPSRRVSASIANPGMPAVVEDGGTRFLLAQQRESCRVSTSAPPLGDIALHGFLVEDHLGMEWEGGDPEDCHARFCGVAYRTSVLNIDANGFG